MAALEILTYPDPRLKQESTPVDEFDDALRAFIDDLEETRLAGPAAVGIAAPQVGRFQRIVIVDCSNLGI
jgi:peptide deformylase